MTTLRKHVKKYVRREEVPVFAKNAMRECFGRGSQAITIELVLLGNTEFTDRRQRMNYTESV